VLALGRARRAGGAAGRAVVMRGAGVGLARRSLGVELRGSRWPRWRQAGRVLRESGAEEL
jgi:hypothetical protein